MSKTKSKTEVTPKTQRGAQAMRAEISKLREELRVSIIERDEALDALIANEIEESGL